MLENRKNTRVGFKRDYTGELNILVKESQRAPIELYWDYNPKELDADMLKLIALDKLNMSVEVTTPYVPYLETNKANREDGNIKFAMIDLIADLKNVKFIAPCGYNKLDNIDESIKFDDFNELIKSNNITKETIIIAADRNEHLRLRSQGVNSMQVSNIKDENGITTKMQMHDLCINTIKEHDGDIVIKDNLLSYGANAVQLYNMLVSETGKKPSKIYVEFSDGLHLRNDKWPSDLEVVSLNNMQYKGYLS